MHTFLTLFTDYAPMLGSADTLVTSIRNFIAPFVLLACSIASLTYLFKREFMQMIIFAISAILVFAVFFAPQFLSSLGESFGKSNEGLTWN